MNAVEMKDYFLLVEVEVVISQMMELCIWVRNPDVNLYVSLIASAEYQCPFISALISHCHCFVNVTQVVFRIHGLLSFTVAYANTISRHIVLMCTNIILL